MKKITILLITLLLLYESLFAASSFFRLGVGVNYEPWDYSLSNTDNLKQKDNYRFVMTANYSLWNHLELSADTSIVSLKPQLFRVDTLLSVNAFTSLWKFRFGVGVGINTEIQNATGNKRLYFTVGGMNFKGLSYAFKHQESSLFYILRFRFFVGFEPYQNIEVKSMYSFDPCHLGRYTNPDWIISKMIDSGSISLYCTYKL